MDGKRYAPKKLESGLWLCECGGIGGISGVCPNCGKEYASIAANMGKSARVIKADEQAAFIRRGYLEAENLPENSVSERTAKIDAYKAFLTSVTDSDVRERTEIVEAATAAEESVGKLSVAIREYTRKRNRLLAIGGAGVAAVAIVILGVVGIRALLFGQPPEDSKILAWSRDYLLSDNYAFDSVEELSVTSRIISYNKQLTCEVAFIAVGKDVQFEGVFVWVLPKERGVYVTKTTPLTINEVFTPLAPVPFGEALDLLKNGEPRVYGFIGSSKSEMPIDALIFDEGAFSYVDKQDFTKSVVVQFGGTADFDGANGVFTIPVEINYDRSRGKWALYDSQATIIAELTPKSDRELAKDAAVSFIRSNDYKVGDLAVKGSEISVDNVVISYSDFFNGSTLTASIVADGDLYTIDGEALVELAFNGGEWVSTNAAVTPATKILPKTELDLNVITASLADTSINIGGIETTFSSEILKTLKLIEVTNSGLYYGAAVEFDFANDLADSIIGAKIDYAFEPSSGYTFTGALVTKVLPKRDLGESEVRASLVGEVFSINGEATSLSDTHSVRLANVVKNGESYIAEIDFELASELTTMAVNAELRYFYSPITGYELNGKNVKATAVRFTQAMAKKTFIVNYELDSSMSELPTRGRAEIELVINDSGDVNGMLSIGKYERRIMGGYSLDTEKFSALTMGTDIVINVEYKIILTVRADIDYSVTVWVDRMDWEAGVLEGEIEFATKAAGVPDFGGTFAK